MPKLEIKLRQNTLLPLTHGQRIRPKEDNVRSIHVYLSLGALRVFGYNNNRWSSSSATYLSSDIANAYDFDSGPTGTNPSDNDKDNSNNTSDNISSARPTTADLETAASLLDNSTITSKLPGTDDDGGNDLPTINWNQYIKVPEL